MSLPAAIARYNGRDIGMQSADEAASGDCMQSAAEGDQDSLA